MVEKQTLYCGDEPIVKTKLGGGTGDVLYQTADGRWWEKWDGSDRTGQEIKTLKKKAGM